MDRESRSAQAITMQLRFREDIRSLVWALLLFPLVPGLALWRPALAVWLLPLAFYTSVDARVGRV